MPDTVAPDELSRSREVINLWTSEQRAAGLTRTISAEGALSAAAKLFKDQKQDSLIPLIGLLQLKGKPYSLRRHFPMEPMFSLALPHRILWKCGRQVSKSTTLAAQGVLQTARIPHFSTIFVTPLYEQIRRFSANYVRPFLTSGLVGQTMLPKKSSDSVLQKTFLNGSQMFFSHAFHDCDRVRGLSGDKLVIDEVQDLDFDFIPIIAAGLDASEDWGIQQYSGTPKTLDNGMQLLWEDSSQAEWIMKCSLCGHWNEPNLNGGILKMVQPKGLSCSNCEKMGIDPARGYWKHMIEDRYRTFAGYHVPQILLPMHYGLSERWERLHEKKVAMPPSMFMNEVLGESADEGMKLITRAELMAACDLQHANTFEDGVKRFNEYPYVDTALGVDWGGGGQEGISLTAIVAAGLRRDGHVDVFQLFRIHPGYKQDEEAEMIMRMYWQYRCSTFGHDMGGGGASRETIIVTSGMQLHHIMPYLYSRVKGGGMVNHKSGPNRSWYNIDKARTLTFMCALIKARTISFPRWETCQPELKDLLTLIEDRVPTRHGGDIYLVTKNPKATDDMAHALNYALLTLFHRNQKWPNLAKQFEVNANEEILAAADPRLLGEADDYDPFTRLEP